MTGFASFVGSGPGDPELLTLKAVDRLRRADVVLYDDLSDGPILEHVRAGAERIAVGKRSGRLSPSQSWVSALLVEQARTGRRVIRLKSGDPALFGRLEEEIVALREAGIEFEIIPGISAASAAAAAASLPLSRRFVARRVQFITGHDVTGSLPKDRNMAALVDPEATTAVFMPKRTFAALVTDLVAHGMASNTPALFAENVGHPNERLIRTTIAALADYLRDATSHEPAVILYGPLMDVPA